MESVAKRGLVTSENFREWPAFDAIKDNDKFSSEYKRLFGTPIIPIHLLNSGSAAKPDQ